MPKEKKRYNHVFSIAFEVLSDLKDDAMPEEVLDGLQRRLNDLRNNPSEVLEAVGAPFDTYEND